MWQNLRRLIPLALGVVVATVVASPVLATDQPDDVIIYVSSTSSGTVDGIDFKDEDILAYNSGTDTWSVHFDGSDVGLSGADLDAVQVLGDGNEATLDPILFSLKNGRSLPGFYADDSDIVEFTPTSLGTTTAGTFSLFIDGSTAGLTRNGEDVDAVGFSPDGRLVVSTNQSFKVPRDGGGTLRGKDEDLIVRETSGDWSLYFDGSDVGLTKSGEDVGGTWVDEGTGIVHLTTQGNFSVPGLSGDRDDIFTFDGTLGTSTSGTFAAYFDGDTHRLPDQQIDGFSIEFQTGTIVIVKDAVPDDPQDFDFTDDIEAPNSFSLDDDPSDGTLSNTKTFSDVAVGTYSVTETVPSGWDLTAASCDDGSPVTTINVSPGETVTCTFTNTQRSSIHITKETTPAGGTGFGFTDNIGGPNAFTLDDGQTKSYTSVVSGTYSVTESSIPPGWSLTGATCDDGSPVTAIDLSPGEAITCTFENSFDTSPVVTPSVGSTAFTEDGGAVTVDGGVTVSDPDDANLAGATVTITNLLDVGDETLACGACGLISPSFSAGVLTLTGVDTVANYQSALQSVTYENTSDAPNTTNRVIRFVASDGVLNSNDGDRIVTVTAVNDAPSLVAPGPYDSLGNVGIDVPAASGLLAGATITDPDFAGPFTIKAPFPTTTANSGALSINTDGSFTYSPAVGFTGVDTFDYQVCDNGTPLPAECSTAKTVTINVSEMIWFIDNTPVGTLNNGSLADPFQSVADFNSSGLPATNHDIYLAETGTDYGTGITLDTGQTLVGEGATGANLQSVLGIPLPGHSNPLPAVGGTSPIIATTNTNAISLALGNTVRGLDIGSTGTGIGLTGTSVGTLTVSEVAVTGTGRVINISTSASSTSNVTFDSVASTSSSGSAAINLVGFAGSFTVANPGAGTDTSITGAGAGISIQGSSGSFSFGETSINSSSAGIAIASSGAGTGFTFDSLSVTTTAGAGLSVSSGGTINIGGVSNTINATGGPALDLTSTVVGSSVTFSNLTSNSSSTDGINLISVNIVGSITANGGSLTNSGGIAVEINNSLGDFTYNGSIDNNSGRSVRILNALYGNTISFGGAIDDDGDGISLLNNGTSTISFTGGLALDTGIFPGFSATNGGTVNVTGTSTIGTAGIPVTGNGVIITDTTIGSSGVAFRSIDVNGGNNGILLDNTGSSGTFTVTGDGSKTQNQSGGTITNTFDDGVSLDDVHGVTLQSMAILNTTGNGVDSLNSSGITLSGVNIETPTLDGLRGINLAGVNRIDNGSLIRNLLNSNTSGISIQNSDNATAGMSLTLNNSTFEDTTSSNGKTFVEFSWRGTGGLAATTTAMTLNVENGTTFQDLFGSAIVVGAGDAAGADGIVDVNVSGSSFINAASNGTNNLEIKVSQDVKATFAIDNNVFDAVGLPSAGAGVVQVQANSDAIMDGSITNNTISNIGSSSISGYIGVQILSSNSFNTEFPGPHQVTIADNEITGIARQGLRVIAFDNTTDLDLTVERNVIGTVASPVGVNGHEAVEIRVGDLGGATGPARMLTLIADNSFVNAGSNEPFDIDAEGNGDVHAWVTGNVFRNIGTAFDAFAATSEDATASFCLDMQNNEAYSVVSTYFIEQSAGVFNSVQGSEAAMTAAQITGTAVWSGTIGTVGSCLLP